MFTYQKAALASALLVLLCQRGHASGEGGSAISNSLGASDITRSDAPRNLGEVSVLLHVKVQPEFEVRAGAPGSNKWTAVRMQILAFLCQRRSAWA